MEHDILGAAEALSIGLTEAQVGALERYEALLASRGVEIGAISAGDRDRILHRHVLDSLRAAPALAETDRIAYDLGSGGGLPGIPLAIAVPHITFVLVESRHWRAAFLEWVAAELELNVRVERARVQDMAIQADVILARAFAPLARTWELASGLLRPGGRLIFFAGASVADPESAARALPSVGEVEVRPNVLAPGGPLVIMGRS